MTTSNSPSVPPVHFSRRHKVIRECGLREAVTLLRDYAFTHRNCHHIMLTTMASNERAIRAYRACGFVAEGRLREHAWSDGRWQDEIVMGILRNEWESARSPT